MSSLLCSSKSERSLHREPGDIILFEEFEDVRLSTVKVSARNSLQMDDKIDILPDVMIMHRVEFEAFFSVSVKCLSANTTNEASILSIILRLSLLVS
jgi:hypothetical protein